jgi:hypothetical protein
MGLYGTSLACYGLSVEGLQVRLSHVDYLVTGVMQLKLEGRQVPGDYYFDMGFLLPCPALRVFDPSTGSGALVPSCTRFGGALRKRRSTM